MHERLAQVTLPLGWITRAQALEELLDLRRLDREIARELQPNLLEDPQVPARHGRARALESFERGVQFGGQSPHSRLALEEAAAQ